MGHSSRNRKDNGTEHNVDYKEAWEISEEKNISKWPRDHSCNILVRNMTVFYVLFQKKSADAKLKSFRFTVSAEELYKQPSIDSLVIIGSLM